MNDNNKKLRRSIYESYSKNELLETLYNSKYEVYSISSRINPDNLQTIYILEIWEW